MTSMKVLAMSGGVVCAAARMIAGHGVVRCTWRYRPRPARCAPARGLLIQRGHADARRVATISGIPFYVWDFAEKFKEDVINDFVSCPR